MTRPALVAVSAVVLLTGCEPTFVDVTYEGAPKCESKKLTADVAVKLEGPRVSSYFRVTGDGQPLTGKLVAGKLYKVKLYKCASEPCEAEANLFHGEDVTAPEGKTGTVAISFKGGPECVPVAPPPAPAAAPADDAGTPAAPASTDAG